MTFLATTMMFQALWTRGSQWRKADHCMLQLHRRRQHYHHYGPEDGLQSTSDCQS